MKRKKKNLERGPGKQKGKRKWIANNTRKIGEKEKTRQMKPPNDDVDTCSSLFSFNISFACTVHLFVYISVSALESQIYRYFFVFFFHGSTEIENLGFTLDCSFSTAKKMMGTDVLCDYVIAAAKYHLMKISNFVWIPHSHFYTCLSPFIFSEALLRELQKIWILINFMPNTFSHFSLARRHSLACLFLLVVPFYLWAS